MDRQIYHPFYLNFTKLDNLHAHVLQIGTITKSNMDPTYFDQLPALTEISDTPEEPILEKNSYLNDTGVSDIPELENFPTLTDLPSFLGTEN